MDADGSNQQQLTFNQNNSRFPDWSPDGSRITFSSGEEIFVMNVDGSNKQQLTDNWRPDLYPDWSPSGRYLVFCYNQGIASEIYIMDADGSNSRHLIIFWMVPQSGALWSSSYSA